VAALGVHSEKDGTNQGAVQHALQFSAAPLRPFGRGWTALQPVFDANIRDSREVSQVSRHDDEIPRARDGRNAKVEAGSEDRRSEHQFVTGHTVIAMGVFK